MAIDTIKSTAVLDGAIATADIADDAVTSAKLDTNIAITGDLTVDTNTLHVDSANNKVGLGIDPGTLPSFVNHAALVSNGGGISVTSASAGDNRYIFFGNGTSSSDIQLAAIQNTNSDLIFKGASGSEKMRILNAGGITFNGDTAADNALNDYEEGRFDILFADVDGGSETLSMRYTKVGQVVHVEGPNRGSAGSSNGQYAILSNIANSNINITCSLPFVPIESGSAISPIHRNLELRSSGTTPVSGYWRPMLAWQAGSATVYLTDTQGANANEHQYWGGANGQTLRKEDTRTNIVVGFNFSYRTAS